MSSDLSKVRNNLPASSSNHISRVQGAISVYYLKFKGSVARIRQDTPAPKRPVRDPQRLFVILGRSSS